MISEAAVGTTAGENFFNTILPIRKLTFRAFKKWSRQTLTKFQQIRNGFDRTSCAVRFTRLKQKSLLSNYGLKLLQIDALITG